MMTKSEKAKAIIQIVDEDIKSALREKMRTFSEWKAAQTGYKTWEQQEKENNELNFGGGLGRNNPYDPSAKCDQHIKANEAYDKWVELRTFVVDTFLDMIDKEEE